MTRPATAPTRAAVFRPDTLDDRVVAPMGPGGNSKNTLAALLRYLCGGPVAAPNLSIADFEHEFAAESLIGAKAVIGDENAVVGRMKFKFLLAFVAIWSILIYYPMVHMVWTPDGILAKTGMLDFAGGTVVHITAGITALFLSIFVGPRIDFDPNGEVKHYNLPWVLMGTSILWIGWYGFNVGSALTVSDVATQAFLTTTVATGTSFVVWMFLDMFIKEKTTMIGLCTGALCGLVGITPAAGYVTVAGAFAIGFICTLASYGFIHVIKPKLKLDDPLDVFGCHGVSGIVGSILTGLFATKIVNPQIENGLLYGGGLHLIIAQILGILFTIIFVGIMTTIIVLLLKKIIPIRVSKEDELMGLDLAEHGEQADYGIEFEEK